MFVALSHITLVLSVLVDLTFASKSSFDLSSLKHRQHKHSHIRHVQRDLLGLGDPLGLNPAPLPSSSSATSSSQSQVSSSLAQSSNANVNSPKPTPAPAPSPPSNGGLLGIPGLSLPGVGAGAGGGLLPSLTLGVGNQNPSPSPSGTGSGSGSDNGGGLGLGGGGGILPSITLGVGNHPSPTVTSAPGSKPSASSGGGGLGLSLPGVSLTVPPIGGGGGGGSSKPGATPSSSGGGLLPPILPSISLSVPPILPTNSGSSGGGIIPTLSIPPIGGSPTSKPGGGSPTGSSIPPIISIPTISLSIPPISIPPIGSTSAGNGGSSSIIVIPPISIPPIGSTSSNGGKPTSSQGIPPISIPTISIGLPTSSRPPNRPTSSQGLPSISIPPPFSSSTPTQSRPTSSSVVSSSSPGSTMTISSTSFESTSTAASTTSIGSEFSFITATTLQITTLPSHTPTGTETDPDVATRTIAIPSSNAPQTSPTLPASLPEMILPSPPLDMSPENLQGMTLITLLYEPQLGYEFVLSNEQTQGQIWAFMPQAIGNALSIGATEVKALWMKPYAPVGYNGDPASLLTIYNAYIPSGSVDSMAHQIQTPQSAYFVGSQGVPGQLANFTVPGFPLLFVADPNTSSNNGGGNGNSTVDSIEAASNRRRDAIIAVCTIIGGIALIVLGWWLYRNYKRRQEGAHQRLADPLGLDRGGYGATDNMMRQRPPSVGPDGIRRNSFYFAEDSLRGYRDQVRDMEEEAQLAASTSGRRHVQGAAISSPILRDNTLNW